MATWKIVPMTEDLIPGCIDALRDTFFENEKICCCVNLLEDSPKVSNNSKYHCTEASIELEHLVTDTAKDGLSLAVVDKKTNEVLGAAFNKLQVKAPAGELGYFEKFAQEHIKDPSANVLVDFMIEVDAKKDLFEHFNADCGLELTFLVVKNSARGQGIGKSLVETTIQTGKDYSKTPRPAFVCSTFSSRFSQKCGERAGLETLADIPYTDFEYKGRKFSEITGPDHPFVRICGNKI